MARVYALYIHNSGRTITSLQHHHSIYYRYVLYNLYISVVYADIVLVNFNHQTSLLYMPYLRLL